MTKSFVIDASTTLKWIFLDEVDSEKALNLQKRFLEEKIELMSPNIWVYEVASGIKTALLRKRIPIAKCKTKLNELLKSSPFLINIEEKIAYCLETSFNYQISVYDSAYITLAILNNIPLVSSDNKLVDKIDNPKICVPLHKFKE